jgi:hypothetical protein
MSYFERIASLKNDAIRVLEARGIEARYLKFGGAGDTPVRTPTVPTDARSEFLANKAMGDWAEQSLAGAIRRARKDWQVTHYGNSEAMAAGEAGFREFYKGNLEEVRNFGKRPDLLVFPARLGMPDDFSSEPYASVDGRVRQAVAAVEVRSSKYEALRYMRVRAEQAAQENKSAKGGLNFTVKVEDLKIVYRWLEHYDKPQAYVQVFFDSVFGINVLQIFEMIVSNSFRIDKPAKSQQKATIMLPITTGKRIGTFGMLPKFSLAEKVTQLGRHDAFVKPVGGDLEIDASALERLLFD